MQKEIQLTDKTLLVVGLPSRVDVELIDIENQLQWLRYYNADFSVCGNIDIKGIGWKLLGIYPELTEEMAKEFIPKYDDGMYVDFINDYTHRYNTALESFQSLMEREKCYTVNPLKFDPTGITTGEWQEAQQRTFPKYAILIKSK